ncbi:hypothetical protein Goari_019636 [Gossypium aridum]|uniref:Uncharacterized protein n=1 Tax=Gossypium aridum TaxID=34290 RepID=A0A7J8WTQ4_GOSAI|nr:hypothetical protein [Gossypium aridum]
MMADDGDDVPSNGDCNTKKVRLKWMDVDLNRAKVVEMISVMAIDSSPASVVFWKDKLVGSGSLESGCELDLEFLDGDIMKSIIKGIPAISFSKRIQKFLVKDMATMMVVKLLGRNVSYTLLILEEIDGLIGKVTKFDFQIDSGSRGMFARMVGFIVWKNLLLLRFGHLQNACPVICCAMVDGVDKSSTPVIILLGHWYTPWRSKKLNSVITFKDPC